MKKNIVTKFADFKKRHSLSNDVIQEMITEYANSELDLASSYFSEKYNISKNTFYKARDYAIICCLIDEGTCQRVKKKVIANYQKHTPNQTSKGPLSRFSRSHGKRQEYLDTFSDNEIIDIAHKYAEGISIQNIAFEYGTGEFGIKLLLKKGIVLLIVDRNTTNSISIMRGNQLNKILAMREQNKKIILECINKEIDALSAQIQNYDLYFRNENEKPSKESLQKKLTTVIQRKKEILRY